MKPFLLGTLALAAAAVAGCTGASVDPASANTEPMAPAPSAARAPSPSAVAEPGAQPIPAPRPFPTIYLKGGFATNPYVEALVGEQVVWRNEDMVAHRIVDDAGFFTAVVLEQGEWWGHAYDAPNVYAYHCTWHEDVRGQVSVT